VRARAGVALLSMILLPIIGCSSADPAARERIVERDQLRREVAGFQSLAALEARILRDRQHQLLVSVTDTLLRSLIDVAFPVSVTLREGLTVTLTNAKVIFRGNVARVDIRGEVRRSTFPRVAAAVTLRGALDRFVVDSTSTLRAHISVDDIKLDTPSGTPAALDPLVITVLQRIVEGSLPELTASLPAVAVPIKLDKAMQLPGFGPDGVLSVAPSRAAMKVEVSRVIAFQDRLWIALSVQLGAFAATSKAPIASAATTAAASAAMERQP
jgi:hypothetical protein